MAKHVDEMKLRVEVDEGHHGALVVYLADGETTMDLAAHYQPARSNHRLLALRAARRSLMKAVRKVERLIGRASR